MSEIENSRDLLEEMRTYELQLLRNAKNALLGHDLYVRVADPDFLAALLNRAAARISALESARRPEDARPEPAARQWRFKQPSRDEDWSEWLPNEPTDWHRKHGLIQVRALYLHPAPAQVAQMREALEAEREACAQVAEVWARTKRSPPWKSKRSHPITRAIRARSTLSST